MFYKLREEYRVGQVSGPGQCGGSVWGVEWAGSVWGVEWAGSVWWVEWAGSVWWVEAVLCDDLSQFVLLTLRPLHVHVHVQRTPCTW